MCQSSCQKLADQCAAEPAERAAHGGMKAKLGTKKHALSCAACRVERIGDPCLEDAHQCLFIRNRFMKCGAAYVIVRPFSAGAVGLNPVEPREAFVLPREP